MKTYRNSIASISLLPDELLSQILFQYVLLADPWSAQWTKILLVCRRWKNVAMGDARLWSFITDDHNGTERMRKWGKRSKDYPLSCRFNVFQHTYFGVFTRNTHRVRSLTLTGSLTQLKRFFEAVEELPILESLNLNSYSSSDDDDAAAAPVWHVPSFIVMGGCPCLRSLLLNGVGFADKADWDHVGNLTHLALEHYPSTGFSLPSLADLVGILQRSPQLKTLKVRHYIEEETLQMYHDQFNASVVLPHLEHLNFNMSIDVVTVLLECLVIPPTTSMYLVPHGVHTTYGGPHDPLSRLLVPLRLHLRRPSAPVLHSLRLNCGVSNSYSDISVFKETVCPEPLDDDHKPHISLVTHPSTQSDLRKILTKIMNAIPLHHACYLDAFGIWERDGQLSPQTWRTALRMLPTPLTVKIGVNDGMVAMLEGLLDEMRTHRAGVSTRRALKKKTQDRARSLQLGKLILVASMNRSRFDGIPPADQEEEQQMLYAKLISFLADYRDFDAPGKPAGTRVGTLEVESTAGGYMHAYGIGDDLFALVDEFAIEGKVWDPVAIARARERQQTKLRQLKEDYPDLF